MITRRQMEVDAQALVDLIEVVMKEKMPREHLLTFNYILRCVTEHGVFGLVFMYCVWYLYVMFLLLYLYFLLCWKLRLLLFQPTIPHLSR